MFTLRNVKYKDILFIESLEIPEKTVTCIVGESGSGKTTLLRLLNHMISCDEGEVLFKDSSISEINPILLRRSVVMLSQTPVIFSGTVRENLIIGLKFSEKPVPGDDVLFKTLELVKLDTALDKDAEKLSGGEKQRLTLARVLLMGPEVFLLDEPSASLDEETEVFVIDRLVNHVREAGKTLIMVTHSKNIAHVFSENTIEIHKGRIRQEV